MKRNFPSRTTAYHRRKKRPKLVRDCCDYHKAARLKFLQHRVAEAKKHITESDIVLPTAQSSTSPDEFNEAGSGTPEHSHSPQPLYEQCIKSEQPVSESSNDSRKLFSQNKFEASEDSSLFCQSKQLAKSQKSMQEESDTSSNKGTSSGSNAYDNVVIAAQDSDSSLSDMGTCKGDLRIARLDYERGSDSSDVNDADDSSDCGSRDCSDGDGGVSSDGGGGDSSDEGGDTSGEESSDGSGDGDGIDGGEPDPDDPDDPSGESDDRFSSPDDRSNFTFRNRDLNIICHSLNNCSIREVLALLLAISVRNSLTYQSVLHLMKTFNVIHGRQDMPVDKKEMWEMLGRSEVGIRHYVYCYNCFTPLGLLRAFNQARQCECGVQLNRRNCRIYASMSIGKQFAELLKKRRNRVALANHQIRQGRIPGAMEDISDGSQYHALMNDVQNNAPGMVCYSYTFNTNGFRLAKSSNMEAWPVYLRWNELPWQMRQKNMILAGVWADLQKPNMNVFLEQFVRQANSLSQDGVQWVMDERQHQAIFVPTCCVVDAMARCAMLNMNSPSGYHACIFCTHAGLHVGGAVHYPYLPPIPLPERRTDETIKASMLRAANEENIVDGFHGPSQLMLMNHLDLGKCIVTDDLHPISGVVKDHISILMTRTRQYRPPYYIGGKTNIRRITRRLLSVRTPTTHITRKPRSMKHYRKWNGSEWRNFLLYYAVPCLDGILPNQYLRHLELLAQAARQAVFIVSRDYVTDEDCDEAEQLFHEYVLRYERYFGRENMRYNTHILFHIVDCVRKWGPLYGHSTSTFESWNHDLMKTVTSPKARVTQIVTIFLIKRFMDNIEYDDDISERIKRQVNVMLHNPRLREPLIVDNVVLLGKCTIRPPNDRERHVLLEQNDICDQMYVYKRAIVDNVEYRSADYRYAGEETKSDNSHVLTWNDEFAQILSVAMVHGEGGRRVIIFLKVLNTNAQRNRYISRVDVGHDVIIKTTFNDVRSPAILFVSPTGTYVMPTANSKELD